MVYPEIITGNPLRAAVAVRFYLNFPGLIGGSATVDVNEIRFGYSKLLASTAGAPENVLHVPVIDTTVFSPEPAVKRALLQGRLRAQAGQAHCLIRFHRLLAGFEEASKGASLEDTQAAL